MTDYDTLRVRLGRRPVTVVELDLDFCANTYGVSPCTAAVGTTGTQKCFNTYNTCQDTAHYSKTTKTYKFCSESAFLPIGENIFPCITDVDIAPTQLKPGSFSVSASVKITMKDFPHHDRGLDPYVSSRSYDPTAQGTFFGKLKARNVAVVNRVMRVNTGYIDGDRTIYTLTRTYFIDRIEGPDASGRVSIIGKDILRFPEIEKTKIPKAATGFLSTAAPSVGTFSITLPSGLGANYAASGNLALEDEIVGFTRSGDTINVTVRNNGTTTATSHPAGTPLQEGFPNSIVSYKPVELIRDLLLASGIDSSYIPYSDWTTESDLYFSANSIGTIFFKPESVKSLIESILEDFGCALWWDELAAEIKFKVISTAGMPSVTLNDNDHFLDGSLSVKSLEKDRFSRIQISFGMLHVNGSGAVPNFVSKLTPDAENMARSKVVIDTASESPNSYGSVVLKTILSRWLKDNVNGSNEASAIASRYLARYSKTPREITFKLDAKDSSIRTGDVIALNSRLLTAPDGSQPDVKCLITQFHEVIVGSQYQYVALELPA